MVDSNDAFAAIREIDAEMKQKELEKAEQNNSEQEAEQQKLAAEKEAADKLAAETAAKENTEAEQKAAAEKQAEENKVSWEEIVANNFKAQAEAEEQAKKQERLAKAEENQFIKSIIDTHLSGGDVKALLKDVDSIDPKSLDEKALFELTLPKGMSAEDKETAYEKFSDLHDSTKAQVIETKRKELLDRQEQITKSLKDNPLERTKQSFTKAMDNIHSAVKELNGKEVEGVGISDKLAAEIFTKATQLLRANQNNDNFDEKQSFKDAITLVTAPYIKEAAIKAGIQKGKVEAANEFHNPSAKNDVKSTAATGEKTKVQMDIETTEAYTKQFTN
jgi:hypothetical protein